jgi:hypothetical protein
MRCINGVPTRCNRGKRIAVEGGSFWLGIGLSWRFGRRRYVTTTAPPAM